MRKNTGLPSEREMKKLSLRAIVAYGVRSVQRVRPLFQSTDSTCVEKVDQAIQIGLDVAAGKAVDGRTARNYAALAAQSAYDKSVLSQTASQVGHAASYASFAAGGAANVANNLLPAKEIFWDVVASAANAANTASAAGGADLEEACRRDFEALVEISGKEKGELGQGIDLSELPPL